jgi:hypothetical protein
MQYRSARIQAGKRREVCITNYSQKVAVLMAPSTDYYACDAVMALSIDAHLELCDREYACL